VGVDCTRCINSACCSLVVEVDEDEYKYFESINLHHTFERYTDKFISEFPRFKDKRDQISLLHKELHAYLKKGDDGLCVLLDRETMLCSIYNNRPKVCVDYTVDRCSKIRSLE